MTGKLRRLTSNVDKGDLSVRIETKGREKSVSQRRRLQTLSPTPLLRPLPVVGAVASAAVATALLGLSGAPTPLVTLTSVRPVVVEPNAVACPVVEPAGRRDRTTLYYRPVLLDRKLEVT